MLNYHTCSYILLILTPSLTHILELSSLSINCLELSKHLLSSSTPIDNHFHIWKLLSFSKVSQATTSIHLFYNFIIDSSYHLLLVWLYSPHASSYNEIPHNSINRVTALISDEFLFIAIANFLNHNIQLDVVYVDNYFVSTLNRYGVSLSLNLVYL